MIGGTVTKSNPSVSVCFKGMRIVVFGPGAVGCWYGGLLAQAGYDVTFIARGTTLEHLRKHPMELRDPNGTTMVAPKIAASLAEISRQIW